MYKVDYKQSDILIDLKRAAENIVPWLDENCVASNRKQGLCLHCHDRFVEWLSKRLTQVSSFGILLVLVIARSTPAMCQRIHEAVKDNNVPEVHQLLNRDPNLIFTKDENGFSPLHLAAANGEKDMVSLLLAAKSDVNAKDNAGSTPLHQAAAAEGEHSDIVELLLAHKAVVNATDKKGLTPLHYATLANNHNVVRSLLKNGADANARDNIVGDTSLILCAAQGNKEVAELLLAYGADVNLADNKGTPLAWAIHTDHPEVADLIRKHGGHE